MKRFIIVIMLALASITSALAQNYAELYIADVQNGEEFYYCDNEYDGVIIHGRPECSVNEWSVNGQYLVADYITVSKNESDMFGIGHIACGVTKGCGIVFVHSEINNPFEEPMVWKRQGDTVTLVAGIEGGLYDFLWSNGATTPEIQVIEDTIYSVTMTSVFGCNSETFSVEVRNNVEIYRAGVDPATNKNRVLWQTTPEQATYVSSVKVERDGMVVGTVPYTDGQFLDNIGSENAARVYRITAIASDGTECPIPSYQFGTFNTVISPDIANPSLMNFTWEDPFIEEGSPYSVVAYRIGRFNENTGEFVAIDQLSANVHLGKYNMDLFDGDYGIVAAVFNDAKRDNEELAFSNRSDNEIVGVGENEASSFSVYPNPSNGTFVIEGPTTITICNLMGQVVAMSQNENGVHTISINTPGVYFVKNDEGTTKRVVIE